MSKNILKNGGMPKIILNSTFLGLKHIESHGDLGIPQFKKPPNDQNVGTSIYHKHGSIWEV